MQLKPEQLGAHLARTLAPIYLVAGEEPLLIQEALDDIRAAARARGFAEREVLDIGKGFDWQRVVDSVGSLSLFASQRIVELRLAGAPEAEGRAVLERLAQTPASDVLLLVVGGEMDRRAREAGWVRAIEQAGASVYCWPVKSAQLKAWLTQRLAAVEVRVDDAALALLAERTEGNLLAAAQEVALLGLLHPGRSIGVEQLLQSIADNARFGAFDLVDGILAGDAAGSVRRLSRLREEGSAVLEVLGALMWSLRVVTKAAVAHAQTRNLQAALNSAGVRPFQTEAYQRAVQRTRPGAALGWLRRAARIDEHVKSGREQQAWEELLTLVLAASGAALPAVR